MNAKRTITLEVLAYCEMQVSDKTNATLGHLSRLAPMLSFSIFILDHFPCQRLPVRICPVIDEPFAAKLPEIHSVKNRGLDGATFWISEFYFNLRPRPSCLDPADPLGMFVVFTILDAWFIKWSEI